MLIEKSKFIILAFIIILISLIGIVFLFNQPDSTELSENISQPNRNPIVKPEQENEEIEPVVEEVVEEKILNPDKIKDES